MAPRLKTWGDWQGRPGVYKPGQAIIARLARPMTVSHAAPGKRVVSVKVVCIAERNQSMSCLVIVIGGRNLITSV